MSTKKPDSRDLCEHLNPTVADSAKRTAEERQAAERQAFTDQLAKRSPPDPIERAEIEKARKRTKARAPRIAMHIQDRGTAGIVAYPDHSDDEGHMYRLADAFGTRSRQFVYSMLNGLGKATEDHSLDCDFSPGSPNQLKFNAALAVIDGVRPQDEIEAMLAAHMAVTNIVLLELVARTRGSIAGHRYEGDGIKRLDVLGNLTNKFMRTYTMQVEALTRKRRKGEQNIKVKHVHVYAGGQAIVGNVSHRGGRGTAKNEQRAYERKKAKTSNPYNSRQPGSAGREPTAGNRADRQRRKKAAADCTAAQAVAAGLLANGMGNTVTASGPRPRLRSGGDSAHC